MKPIQITPSIVTPELPAYVHISAVSFLGIDGEERSPWLDQMNIEDLLKLLED